MMLKKIILLLVLIMVINPAQAQTDTRIAYNDFGFSFDPALAANVNITPIPDDNPITPTELAHTEFTLYNDTPSLENNFSSAGEIQVYQVSHLGDFEEYAAVLEQLQSMLAARPDLTTYMDVTSGLSLPYLPILYTGSQIIRARAQYVENDSLVGISYIAIYVESNRPLIATDVQYTFQGLSKDGMYYSSATFPADPNLFPVHPPVVDMDFRLTTDYLMDTVQQLNVAAPDDFNPSLTILDKTIQSFAFAS